MLKIRCDDLDRKCRNEGGGGGREGRECSSGICSVSALWALFTKRDVLCCVVLCCVSMEARLNAGRQKFSSTKMAATQTRSKYE